MMDENPSPNPAEPKNILDILKSQGKRGAAVAEAFEDIGNILLKKPNARVEGIVFNFMVAEDIGDGDSSIGHLVAMVGNSHDIASMVQHIQTGHCTQVAEEQQQQKVARLLRSLARQADPEPDSGPAAGPTTPPDQG